MKFKGTLIGPASGSMAGVTASRNRGGQYFRFRATPTNPNSLAQQTVRNQFAACSAAWRSVPESTKEAWTNAAANVVRTNPLGDPVPLTGSQLYCAVQTFRLNAGLAAFPTAPTAPGSMPLELATPPVAPEFGNSVAIDLTNAFVAGDVMQVAIAGPMSTGINYYKGPFRSAVTSSVVGTAQVAAFPSDSFVLGQRYFVRIRATDTFGRLSELLMYKVDVSPL